MGRNPGFRPFLFARWKVRDRTGHPKTHVPKGGTWSTRQIEKVFRIGPRIPAFFYFGDRKSETRTEHPKTHPPTPRVGHPAPGIATKTDHRKLLIRMTSLLSLPRVNASCLPSRDHSKSKISPESKCVTCFGGPPVRRCCQMLETPFRVSI